MVLLLISYAPRPPHLPPPPLSLFSIAFAARWRDEKSSILRRYYSSSATAATSASAISSLLISIASSPSAVLSVNGTSEDISGRDVPPLPPPPPPPPPTAPLAPLSPLYFSAAQRQSILSPSNRSRHGILNPQTRTVFPLCFRPPLPLPLPLLLQLCPRPHRLIIHLHPLPAPPPTPPPPSSLSSSLQSTPPTLLISVR